MKITLDTLHLNLLHGLNLKWPPVKWFLFVFDPVVKIHFFYHAHQYLKDSVQFVTIKNSNLYLFFYLLVDCISRCSYWSDGFWGNTLSCLNVSCPVLATKCATTVTEKMWDCLLFLFNSSIVEMAISINNTFFPPGRLVRSWNFDRLWNSFSHVVKAIVKEILKFIDASWKLTEKQQQHYIKCKFDPCSP